MSKTLTRVVFLLRAPRFFQNFLAGGPTSATGVAVPGGRPAATECVAAVLETAVPPDRDLCTNRLEDRCPLMATVMTSRRCRVTPSE
ncbi:hypothetical protein K0M31_006450 [Melipona bicolor]|uniref:Uncharacterized protein n=1 Tax=Melipona bicolor TaxID=60889 RepID=A0AA40KLX5_9HYME|nr:hypothetical protein K0M31_006450 [Melipona bicolor]